MKIAFATTMHGAPWGGSEELWSQAALRLQAAGHNVVASVPYWPQLSPRIIALSDRGVNVQVRDAGPRTFSQRLLGKVNGRNPRSPEICWLQKHRPDLVVISQGGYLDGLGWMQACRRQQIPFTPIVHCNTETWWPNDELALELAGAYGSAERVFCVSRHNLELLERQIGQRLPQAEIARNPYNVSPDRMTTWPASDQAWHVACVARLEPLHKGQDLLLQVLALPIWSGRPMHLHFYGNGPCEQSLRRMADDLQLNHVHFHGHVPDVASIWEQNHLLVLASRCEGTPIALVEAMWCSRPAVVTDVGGNAEMCLDGVTGFVAAAPTVALFDQAMQRAWDQRQQWQALGTAARQRVEQLVGRDPVGDFCKQLLACTAPHAPLAQAATR